jgi:tRNA(Ile)-lysidine synthase
MSMIETIKACLMRNSVDGAVTIALSGGVDSMVLLDVVSRLREASSASPGLSSLSVDALHVHHGLSPNADMWAEFCTAQCATRGVPLKVVRVAIDRQTTEGQGIEGLARARRYEALRAHGAKWTLAGQHADDQAETVLHQLLRGTGLAGLAAMGETREFAPGQWLVRPLLGVTRGDIEAYAAAHQLRWIEDESNADTAYLRNYIRHDLAPLIAARFPHYRASLARAARHAAEAAALNEAWACPRLRTPNSRSGRGRFFQLLPPISHTRQVATSSSFDVAATCSNCCPAPLPEPFLRVGVSPQRSNAPCTRSVMPA